MQVQDVFNYVLGSIGAVAVLISFLGYISNRLNWTFLNHTITDVLYNVGATVHELSHAIVCVVTGAKIVEFSVFSRQPHVSYIDPKVPWVSNPLISFAPIAGGLAFLYVINHFLLGNYFVVPHYAGWASIWPGALAILHQIHFADWQSWVMILLFINVGAMIGPSMRDLQNIWPILLLLLLVQYTPIFDLGLLVASLIVINIIIQLVLVLGFSLLKWAKA